MASPIITKKVLSGSMKKLMLQRPLSKISIGDIVADCGLNRNSFYYHFKDKYDLVNWIFYTEFMDEFRLDSDMSIHGFFLSIYQFFNANKTFYLNALSVKGQNCFSEYFTDIMKALIMPQIQKTFPDEENHRIYANLFTGALLATINGWLAEKPLISPEKMAELTGNFLIGIAKNISDLPLQDPRGAGEGFGEGFSEDAL